MPYQASGTLTMPEPTPGSGKLLSSLAWGIPKEGTHGKLALPSRPTYSPAQSQHKLGCIKHHNVDQVSILAAEEARKAIQDCRKTFFNPASYTHAL
jgi:hypothetical protein